MKHILEYTICRSDDKPVMTSKGEVHCSSVETQSDEAERDMTTKELIDYASEGCYHEAGHAIVRAYLRMPLVSVTVEFVEGVHGGYTHVVLRRTATYQDFIGAAMFAAAGRVATDIYAESTPGMNRFDKSDGQDQEFIDAKAQQIRARLGVDPRGWKAGIVARTAAILRIPYVWAAVEKLAEQLEETEGAHAIMAKHVRKILWKAEEKAEAQAWPILAESGKSDCSLAGRRSAGSSHVRSPMDLRGPRRGGTHARRGEISANRRAVVARLAAAHSYVQTRPDQVPKTHSPRSWANAPSVQNQGRITTAYGWPIFQSEL
jgi:hypothetical protein